MLNEDTRRRIDTARDILVGKVPDPKSQVEQITIALVYKFMDDMDQQSIEMGGKASFFTGDYARYAWRSIFDPRLGGPEMLGLYADAITSMSQNPNLPQLFRDIFRNAFLPYRDPETLKLFLKTINEFTYDNSERLGDAFEYLLSIMGSQGEAGQFRTPRHIIDFMVRVIKPQKNESVLDPACGTAGFLISSYRHILEDNQNRYPGDLLTPDERTRLMTNFTGYDISPDMVRLSRVNLFLHGFSAPKIYEYDTLTSLERWNDFADVIMANPPFMSPKGGIRPHKQFSVQSNRSEVLFVDYIAEHLTPTGRAAVIVPEGIIFQSGKAYKQLRRRLVEKDFLWAVVSLPGGVFNPYSGVKTSILFLDRALAKKTDQILFVKVTADGFDLGAQRRENGKNDLPEAQTILEAWQKAVREGQPGSFDPASFSCSSVLVDTKRLAENGDYNLSADRYREVDRSLKHQWPMVVLGNISEIISGQSPEGSFYNEKGEGMPFYQGKTEFTEKYIGEPTKWTTQVTKVAQRGDILLSVRAPVGPVNIATQQTCIGRGLAAIRPDKDKVLLEYVFSILNIKQEIIKGNSGSTFESINRNDIAKISIPLPPLEIQRQIVDEIAGYQRIIDGARQVVEGWKPDAFSELKDALTPDRKEWQLLPLGDVCTSFKNGANFSKDQVGRGVKFINIKDIFAGRHININSLERIDLTPNEIEKVKLQDNDIVFVRSSVKYEGVGFPALVKTNGETLVFCGFIIKCSPRLDLVLPEFLLDLLQTEQIRSEVISLSNKANITNISQDSLKTIKIPLPPIEIQKQIESNIEHERQLVDGNHELIRIYEEKIQKVINQVWEG